MAKLSSDNTYVTVEKGDTLSQIAKNFSHLTGGVPYQTLARNNDIDNPDLIYVGQKIVLVGSVPKSSNSTSKASIKHFGLQSDTDRTVFATWVWDKRNTETYQVKWEYDTGDDVWFVGSNSTVDIKQSVYNAPTNAKRVRFHVKPISQKRKINGKESSYWTANWSTAKTYSFSDNPPSIPASTPTVEVKGFKLTASLQNITGTATIIQFALFRDGTKYKTGKSTIKASAASFEFDIVAGSEYTVQCRSYGNGEYSDWSSFTNPVGTIPATPKGFTKCILKGDNHDQVHLEWKACATATDYEIEWTKDQSLFDNTNSLSRQRTDGLTKWTFDTQFALDSNSNNAGQWFFRLRAINGNGESGWSPVSSTSIGKAPSAPTTWSSTNSVIVGEPLTLYWVHNSEDGSSQTYADIRLTIGPNTDTISVPNSTEEDEKDKTSSYTIDTSEYTEGTTIVWSVSTRGEGDKYSEWSVSRTVHVYAAPSIDLTITDANENEFNILETFSFKIRGITEPDNQKPIGFHVSITSNDSYSTIDSVGNEKKIITGQSVYDKYIDSADKLELALGPGDMDLENNVTYTIVVVAHMNSGLTAKESRDFTVAWSEDENIFEPNAEIAYDDETYSTYIRPYCDDAEGNPVDGITLSVYRREFDGSFTEIGTGIDNASNKFILDPHPALDFARYRIVARTDDTGAITYSDIPGYPIGCTAIIIQWDEVWSSFDTRGNSDVLSEQAWTGSLLKLMYNIDVSDKTKRDVELVEYIGRARPVAYHGTQLGESSTWNVEIPADDKETLYALRRLSIWMGNVYVREPSGSGYWASVDVSFSQKHCGLTIPVTIDVTRVEGGI